TPEAKACSAIMRPNISTEMPPTKPADAPSRATPTATLKHDPPTMGTTASRPSAAITGTKSISASPQLSIIVSPPDLSSGGLQIAHRLAASAINHAQQLVDVPL